MNLTPADHFVKPVPDEVDLFRFVAGGKALVDQEVTVEDNGDLTIQGYAAIWEGDDREGENFAPGAFQRATKAFLESNGPLCFHHKHDHILGTVSDLSEDSKGLKMRARVDGAIQTHPVLGTIYEQIKNKTLRSLSVGGVFKRSFVDGKRKITDMDFTEISVTGVPVHTGPSFAVVAGKALTSDIEVPAVPETLVDEEIREQDLQSVKWALEELDGLFTRIEKGVAERKTTQQSVSQDAVV